jgi:cytochrome c oxidase subunit 2
MVVLMGTRMKLLVFMTLLFSHAAMQASAPAAGQTAGRRVVDVTAERFEFWPSEIALAEGEEIEIRLTSEDTAHGFRIVGTGTNVVVPKRGMGTIAVVFRAERAGRFEFECSRMCGAGHSFMRGELRTRAAGR